MSVLSNRDIWKELDAGNLVIDPMEDEQVQPASVDLTLGEEFIVFRGNGERQVLHPGEPVTVGQELERSRIVLGQGDFVLGTTREWVELPPNIKAQVQGVSSNARRGLVPHTAGLVDPGFEGHITLELANLNPCPIELLSGQRIAQLDFVYLNTPANPAYGEKGGKYQRQRGVTSSRLHEEFSTSPSAEGSADEQSSD